jgi:ATP-binding cassette subfamily F protein uup
MNTPLLTLKNLSLTFSSKKIFDDVTFTLHEGDKIGLLGLNGHGKSTLLKVVARKQTADITVPPFSYDESKDLSLFYVPQEMEGDLSLSLENYFYYFYPHLWEIKLAMDVVGEGLGNAELTEEQMDKLLHKQEELFSQWNQLGADRIYDQYLNYLSAFGLVDHSVLVQSLSGGEQRKVALSLGLSCPHKVVLWDEPTNHLDVETIKLFEEELQNSKKTLMIISHDRSLLHQVVDRILHIQKGKLKTFQGTYAEYLVHLQEEQHRREKQLDVLANHHRREALWMSRGPKARRTKSKKRIEGFSELNERIATLKAQAHGKVDLNLQNSGRKTKQLIEAKNISLQFGQRVLFSGVNFILNKGDKIALMGQNGVGKSSLLQMILGQQEPSSGEILRASALDVGVFSQKRESLPLTKTPWDLVGEGIDFVMSNTGEKKHVVSYLESFLFTAEEVKRPISTFSGGEKNRLQLAQFMKHSRDLWIFDEPTNDLDLETIGILEEELKNYQGALIVVGHDRSFIENVTDQCWLLHDQVMQKFDGGWEQAEAYLEVVALEKQLQKVKPQMEKEKKNKSKSLVKPEVLEKEISSLEAVIADLEQKLGAVDYKSPSSVQDIKKLQESISFKKKELADLYAKWEELQD